MIPANVTPDARHDLALPGEIRMTAAAPPDYDLGTPMPYPTY